MKLFVTAVFGTTLLTGSINSPQGATESAAGTQGAQLGIAELRQNKSPAGIKEQEKLHIRCLEAGERTQQDATAMIPGRTWTWQLGLERSRQQLGRLRSDLDVLRNTEAKFEASLTVEQKSRVQSRLSSIQKLLQHLDIDTQSLDLELREGYPTRWHVRRDALDMQKEMGYWIKLHAKIAAALE
jgi:hypothetical protein